MQSPTGNGPTDRTGRDWAPLRIGAGAGFSSDRLDPAIDLAKRGELDALVFECIGERTLAAGHRERRTDPTKGYNRYLAKRLEAILPLCATNGTRIVTNMGVTNPRGAAQIAVEIARRLGLYGLALACVEGDDVTELIDASTEIPELGRTVKEVGRTLIGANAYIGADALRPAFNAGANIVIAGRVADPSLFLAPMIARFDWADDDWVRLGRGTVVGHLIECAGQVTGGYFADPGPKPVRSLANLGFPIAEVDANGAAVITKLDGTGGVVDVRTVKEQLLYEIHDPAAYLTPDVTADLSEVEVAVVGPDRVQVSGAGGRARPEKLKALLSFDGGYLAEGEIGYAGPGAAGRAQLAADILRERMSSVHGINEPLRVDLIGLASLHGSASAELPNVESSDVRVRAALRTLSADTAELLLWETEGLLNNGPAGGGGFRGHVSSAVVTYSAYIERQLVSPRTTVTEV